MGEQQDFAVNPEEPSGAPEGEPKSAGFSIGKLIEWLLSNLIPVIIAVVVSTIIAFILVRTSVTKKSEEVYKTQTLTQKPNPMATFPLGDFRMNTADIDEPHFIRVAIELAYDDNDKKLPTELAQRNIQLRDIVFRLLNSKTKDQIDEAVEKERLKEEIIKAVNNVLQNGEIKDVYYTEFVIS
jgi:flagellar FliL protein